MCVQSKSLLREDGELHSKTPAGTGAGDKSTGPNFERRKSEDDVSPAFHTYRTLDYHNSTQKTYLRPLHTIRISETPSVRLRLMWMCCVPCPQGGVSTPHSSHMVGGRLYLQASLFTPQLSRQNSFTRLSQKTPLDFEPFQANSISSLPEARLRLLTVLKHVYWGCFQNGLLSPHGLRCVNKHIDICIYILYL